MANKCANCQKETKNPKFCSRTCSATISGKLFPKRKTTKVCLVCQQPVKGYRFNRCEFHYNEYMNKSITQNMKLEDYWNKPSLKNLHPSSKNAHIRGLARSQHKDLAKLPCYVCGYNKHVELCHIKAIRFFSNDSLISEVNGKSNIVQLCRNCHWEFDHNMLALDFPDQPESH